MQVLENAILRTVLYADVFNFPLTGEELHRYLIHDKPCSQSKINDTLQQSSKLDNLLYLEDTSYVCLKSRKEIIGIRREREAITLKLWQDAIRYGQLLSRIPFVRMVVLTGAVAVRNPSSHDDDYDYLLVTKPGRVWLARAFAVLIVRLIRLRGRELCPNYVLAEDSLEQTRQDLYMAHEVAQMRPIYGNTVYQKMFVQNPWVTDYLPNALPFDPAPDKARPIRSILETLLGGWVGDKLEAWEYRRKLDKFMPKVHQAQSTAEINKDSVKGHFQDHGMPVLERYEVLLKEYALTQQIEAVAGD